MNKVISYIVENQLLASKKVTLPQIGTLQVERHSAQLTADGLGIEAPWEALVFHNYEDEQVELTTDSIYSHLERYMQASISNYNFENAKVSYQQWLEEVYNNLVEPLEIEGICRLVYLNGEWELSDINSNFDSLLLQPEQEILSLSVENEINELESELQQEWISDINSEQNISQGVILGEQSHSSSVEVKEAYLPAKLTASNNQVEVEVVEKREREQRVPRSSTAGIVIAIMVLLGAVGYLIYMLYFS